MDVWALVADKMDGLDPIIVGSWKLEADQGSVTLTRRTDHRNLHRVGASTAHSSINRTLHRPASGMARLPRERQGNPAFRQWLERSRYIAPFIRRFGPTHEWHLLFPNAFQHIAFGFMPGLHEAVVGFGPAFFTARFIAVRSIRDSMGGDGLQ